MAAVTAVQLAQHSNLLVITSTYGDGEPPDNAKALHSELSTFSSQLSTLRYSICALGDTNYTLFCQCGKDFDLRLEKLGATRIAPRADCELDYETAFAAWLDTALTALGSAATHSSLPEPEEKPAYSKQNPYPAPVLAVRNLNAPGSAKEVNHVEFSLEGSGLVYEVGDALGVVPRNCPELVSAIITALGCDGEEAVSTPVGELPLRTALLQHYDLGKPPRDLITLSHLTEAHHVIDVLLNSDVKFSPATFITTLKKLQPRLYSISSSPKAHAGQVHLTVGAVRYDLHGRPRKGVCSTFLAERALAHGTAGVFIHSNKAFRPPTSGDTPMIMVGPGTGIAPFRAFLHERAATGAKGKNWLFFGDQKANTDFLYREELAALQSSGILTRLDLAFSRDQKEKIYVQHRMLETAAELYAWLEAGGYFYVCGDASRMAKDVDAALHKVVETAGKKSPEEAAAYVQSLKTAKRYQRDVY